MFLCYFDSFFINLIWWWSFHVYTTTKQTKSTTITNARKLVIQHTKKNHKHLLCMSIKYQKATCTGESTTSTKKNEKKNRVKYRNCRLWLPHYTILNCHQHNTRAKAVKKKSKKINEEQKKISEILVYNIHKIWGYNHRNCMSISIFIVDNIENVLELNEDNNLMTYSEMPSIYLS